MVQASEEAAAVAAKQKAAIAKGKLTAVAGRVLLDQTRKKEQQARSQDDEIVHQVVADIVQHIVLSSSESPQSSDSAKQTNWESSGTPNEFEGWDFQELENAFPVD